MQADYDVVIVGSGPISMMEATHLARGGSTVLLLEEKSRLGGAWYTKNQWGFENLEVGCHKATNIKAAYDFIESLGIEMFEMDPQPQLIIRGLPNDVGLKWKGFYALTKTLNWTLGRGSLISYTLHDRLKYLLKGNWRLATRDYQYKYFRNGCSVLIAALQTLAQQAGVIIETRCSVQEIHVDEDRGRVVQDGNTIRFERCIVSPYAHFQLFCQGEEVPLRREEFQARHFLFKIQGRKLFDFLHLDVLNTDLIRQLTDVGYYVGSDVLILCANVLKGNQAAQNHIPIAREPISEQQENELINDIFSALKTQGYISSDSILLDAFMEPYDICRVAHEEMARVLKQTGDRVSALWTGDLAEAIELKVPEWTSLTAHQYEAEEPVDIDQGRQDTRLVHGLAGSHRHAHLGTEEVSSKVGPTA